MTTAQIVPALLIPLIVWRIYSRVRRNIGRQRLRPGRLRFGAVAFALLIAAVALGTRWFPESLVGLGAGVAVAVPLALLGLRLTRFEISDGDKFYTPNAILGLA